MYSTDNACTYAQFSYLYLYLYQDLSILWYIRTKQMTYISPLYVIFQTRNKASREWVKARGPWRKVNCPWSDQLTGAGLCCTVS